MDFTSNKEVNFKNEFETTARKYIQRSGIEDILTYLADETDFYEAPASTKFHGAYKGALAEHSLNVFKCLMRSEFLKDFTYENGNPIYTEETIAIVALFHDICKANFYGVSTRNAKNEFGQWVKVPYYTVEDKYPYGHGEKSVYLLMREGLKLKDEEALAIRWHMSGFTDSVKGGSYSLNEAYNNSPLAVELALADMRATYLLENKDN